DCRMYCCENKACVIFIEPGTLRKVTLAFLAAVPAAGAEKQAHTFRAELVQLVDCPQHGQPAAGVLVAAEADGFQNAVEHLAVVDADDVVAARNTERLH